MAGHQRDIPTSERNAGIMLILDRCGIVVGDRERTVHNDGIAIAVDGDRIAAIGTSDEIRARYSDAEVLDMWGKIAFPGFVNTHTHTVLTGLRGLAEDQGPHSLYGQMYPMKSIITDEHRYALGMLGAVDSLRSGTTTLVENYQGATAVAPAVQKLGIRAVLSDTANDAVMVAIRRGRYEFSAEQGEAQLQAGVSLVEKWHGAENGRITCQLSAHAPDTCSREFTERIVRLAEQYDVGLHVHCAQTPQEVEQVRARENQTPVEFLESTGYLGPRTIAAHCVHLTPTDLQTLGRTRTNIAHNSLINARRGKWAPAMHLEAAGANIGLGSDNMHEDMVAVVRSALVMNRVREGSGTTPDSYHVLDWLTMGGARALGMEREIGSLEVGKKADIVLVDFRQPHLQPLIDPVVNFVHNGMARDVDTVLVDGEIVVCDGHTVMVDEQEAIDHANEMATDFWRRFESEFGGTVMAQG
jgi:5-methylthioadenosine/S-adenosylhomocysteine deaminase